MSELIVAAVFDSSCGLICPCQSRFNIYLSSSLPLMTSRVFFILYSSQAKQRTKLSFVALTFEPSFFYHSVSSLQ